MIYDPYEEDSRTPPHDVYSRYSQPVRTRAEHILSKINVRGFITRSLQKLRGINRMDLP